jgi:hypothetical protein
LEFWLALKGVSTRNSAIFEKKLEYSKRRDGMKNKRRNYVVQRYICPFKRQTQVTGVFKNIGILAGAQRG